MSTSMSHAFRQGPTVLSLLGTLARSVICRGSVEAGTASPVTGQEFTAVVPPRHPGLVSDYIRHVGGDPRQHRDVLPSYMFPQWGMPMLARTLKHLHYDMRSILNGGFTFEVRAPIPAGEPLYLRSKLEEVDDDGRRAIFKELLVTGTESSPEALVTRVVAILPLKPAGKGERREKPLVPQDACEIARLKLPHDAGLDFGMLSGDLNPVHWSTTYARMAGFKSTIMHGFSVAARR